jgi:hypothetical protein
MQERTEPVGSQVERTNVSGKLIPRSGAGLDDFLQSVQIDRLARHRFLRGSHVQDGVISDERAEARLTLVDEG